MTLFAYTTLDLKKFRHNVPTIFKWGQECYRWWPCVARTYSNSCQWCYAL